MTTQYLMGELSLILAELQSVTSDQVAARDVGRLRREAETTCPSRLGPVVVRALALSDTLCWKSLADFNCPQFGRQAAVASELFEFGVCSGLLNNAYEALREQGRCP